MGSGRRRELFPYIVRLTTACHTDMQSFMAADDTSEPYNTLVRAFSSYGDIGRDKIRPLIPYLERMSVPEGLVLFNQNEEADGLYLIESGVLRASYKFAEHTPRIEESMVPGALAGELSALAGLPRNATVAVERQAVLWKLSTESMRRLETENPEMSRLFIQLVLKGKYQSMVLRKPILTLFDSGQNRLRHLACSIGDEAVALGFSTFIRDSDGCHK